MSKFRIKRVLSSIIGLPILIVLVIMGGLWLQIALGLVVVIGLYEFYKSFGKINILHILGIAYGAGYMALLGLDNFEPYLLIIIFVILNLIMLVIFYDKIKITDCMNAIFGFIYIAILTSTIFLITQLNLGRYLIWLVFLSAWGCDTGAYTFGKLFGKRKLIPKLSPNKTIAGAIGGGFLAALLCGIYGYIIYSMNFVPFRIVYFSIIIGLIGAIAAQFGDLSASAIKRHTGKKDFGNLIPGHGGILDRFDSILFTAPMVYIFLIFL